MTVSKPLAPDPVAFLAWIGRCGVTALGRIPPALLFLRQRLSSFVRDILHGMFRILRFVCRMLLAPVRLRNDASEKILGYWQAAKGKSAKEKAIAILKIAGVMLFSDNGILVSVYAIAVPVMCSIFLFSIVRYGTGINYGVEVSFNGSTLGVVSQESDYTEAEVIVRRRLSYTEQPVEMEYRRSFTVRELTDGTELLTAGTLADLMLESTHVSIQKGYGVYVNDTFYGAVEDFHPIENALQMQLSNVTNQFLGDLDEIYYADTVKYEQGSYLGDSFVESDSLIEKFTSAVYDTKNYYAGTFETPESVAQRFSISKEEVQLLNPELGAIIPQGTPVTVPVMTRFLPIIFKRTFTTLSLISYDTVEIETNELPLGKQKLLQAGEKGERRNTVQATYSDGSEMTRSLLYSSILSEPVPEQIGVGTYTPKPASDSTVLTGSGRFSWPLDGGRISDHFGGERRHRGIDLAAPLGTNIFAADDGVVRVASVGSSYGYYLIIDHQDGTETLYAHCSLLLATPGQEVKRGQIIAHVGSTGHSTGPHLHFEVRVNGLNCDPALFLRVNAD